MTYIKEAYHSNMSLREAETLILQVLKNVMEEKITNDNVEISVVKTDTKRLEARDKAYIEDIVKNLS